MSEFKGRHFEGGIVLWAVRWYCRYGVGYRDLEQMMGERGVLAAALQIAASSIVPSTTLMISYGMPPSAEGSLPIRAATTSLR